MKSYRMPEFTTNPIQQEAISFTAGAMQVLAGPGSGKTFVITRRIRYLIENYNVEPSKILVITFTKAAAKEMQQRFEKLTAQTRAPVHFGTFHAIFYHILRQTAKYRNFTLITETEKRKLLLQILHMPVSQLFVGNEKTEYLIRTISQIKNNGESFAQIPCDLYTKEEIRAIYHQYNEYLAELEKMDFDDMGLLCLKLFQEHPDMVSKWQEQYRYIMVDEFQDINWMQYQIVRAIAHPHNNLFIVGDDDQSIYGFRGAKPDIMRQFMADYPNAKQVLLDRNYRCHEQIVKKSLQVIAPNKNRFVKVIHAVHRDGEGVILHPFPDQDQEYEAFIQMLKDLAQNTVPEELSHIAIIYRTNYECSLLAEKLLLHEIPFLMKEPVQSRYDHFVIKDLLAYLEFANGNRRREIFHLFMNRPLRYLKKDSARKENVFLDELLQYYENDPVMQKTAHKLFYDLEKIAKMRPSTAIRYIRQVIGYDAYIKEQYDKNTSDKLLQIADDFQTLAKGYQVFWELTDYISQFRKNMKEKQQKRDFDSVSPKPNGICLMTMHASKGLEFDTVYLPDVIEGKIPSRQSSSFEAIEEERRMFYVAMTRAKKELHILYCDQEEGRNKPSRFLEPILGNQRPRCK